MRQKTTSSYFTFLYPGRMAGIGEPPKNAPCIAIPNNGEWVSISGDGYGGEQPSAVFYNPQALRDLAHVLEEAADLFEENQIKNKKSKQQRVIPHIFINGKRLPVFVEEIAFEQLVETATETLNPTGDFLVQYTRGCQDKPSGTLLPGQTVRVKDGMEFDVVIAGAA